MVLASCIPTRPAPAIDREDEAVQARMLHACGVFRSVPQDTIECHPALGKCHEQKKKSGLPQHRCHRATAELCGCYRVNHDNKTHPAGRWTLILLPSMATIGKNRKPGSTQQDEVNMIRGDKSERRAREWSPAGREHLGQDRRKKGATSTCEASSMDWLWYSVSRTQTTSHQAPIIHHASASLPPTWTSHGLLIATMRYLTCYIAQKRRSKTMATSSSASSVSTISLTPNVHRVVASYSKKVV